MGSSRTVVGDGLAEIFVSIASYRDTECQYTICDLMEKAKHTERVVVGVCFQQAPEDRNCFVLDTSKWKPQLRTLFIPHKEAKGPCFARSLVEKELYKGEEFFLQIDSHLRFVRHWDVLLLEQFRQCANPRAVLTSHVSSYTLPKDYEPGQPDRASISPRKSITAMCADTFGDPVGGDVFLRVKSRVVQGDLSGKPPFLSPFWTARFSFSRGELLQAVPYDPHLEYIFFGEEISMTVRLWTHGWDLYNPTKVVAYHLGSRAHRRWFRESQQGDEVQREELAKRRILGMLGDPDCLKNVPPAQFGLGTARTLKQYEAFAGVNFRAKVVEDRARTGLLKSHQLPPAWAEEMMEQASMASQMKDPASWAGKDNADALGRQFPEAKAPSQVSAAELETAREVTRVQVYSLQAQLGASSSDSDVARIHLELSKAFASLGRAESSADKAGCQRATDAYGRALQSATEALERCTPQQRNDPFWRASVSKSLAASEAGVSRVSDAKASLLDALSFAVKVMSSGSQGDDEERLASEILELVHAVHEQLDDREGLCQYMRGIQAMLSLLQRSAGAGPPRPFHTPVRELPESATVSVRAQLLERMVLVSIATGREKDLDVAKTIFSSFDEARESAGLLRLLGLLQSTGRFLDADD